MPGNPLPTLDPPAPADTTWRFGAALLSNGKVRFQLWAPNAAPGLTLEVDGHALVPLVPDAQGFAVADVACAPGTRYRYRLADGRAVPDPASRLQAGDVHDDSVVISPVGYAWQHAQWTGRPWRDSVIYELHPGLAGGFAGITRQLPDLAALGITLLELMPIADFPGTRNWGYDGVLPFAPDTAYGTPDALKALVDTAHGLGMGVMLDVVYNHFGPDGNYLADYAGDFFRDDIRTPWGSAIDFRRPAVRRYFQENALYWLQEYRIDGLRLDAVHAIADHGWLPELAATLRASLPGRHVHLVLENDDNAAHLLEQGYDAQWNDDAHHVLHHLLTGETRGYYAGYTGQPGADLARALSEGFVYQGQPSAHHGGTPRGEPSAHLPPLSFVTFLQNHDQAGNRPLGERLIHLTEPARLRDAVALQLLCPHVPLIFMGEEFGARTPFLYFTDHLDPALAQAVRDGRRGEFAGFFDDGDTRRVPDPNAARTHADSDPWTSPPADADDWRRLYRSLLALRRAHLAPRLEGCEATHAQALDDRAVHVAWRLQDGTRLAVLANFGPASVALPQLAQDDARLPCLWESRPEAARAAASGTLPPGVTWFLEDAQ